VVGPRAFAGCVALRWLDLAGDRLWARLARLALEGCRALLRADLPPRGLLADGAFSGCLALAAVRFAPPGWPG